MSLITNTKIVAVVNHKGGVGKTASVAALGAAFATWGKRVLMVDLDAQSNLTRHFLPELPKPDDTIFKALEYRSSLPISKLRDNLYLTPSHLLMADIEVRLSGVKRREFVLTDLLRPIADDFDYIFLDCPPSLGLVTSNALAVSNRLIVPMIPDLLSAYGVDMLNDFCVDTRDLNSSLKIDYIFFTKYEKNLSMTTTIESDMRTRYGDKVLKSVIRKNVDIAQANFAFTDIFAYAPKSTGAADYAALAKELIDLL